MNNDRSTRLADMILDAANAAWNALHAEEPPEGTDAEDIITVAAGIAGFLIARGADAIATKYGVPFDDLVDDGIDGMVERMSGLVDDWALAYRKPAEGRA